MEDPALHNEPHKSYKPTVEPRRLTCLAKRSMVYWTAVGFSRMVVTSQNRIPRYGQGTQSARRLHASCAHSTCPSWGSPGCP